MVAARTERSTGTDRSGCAIRHPKSTPRVQFGSKFQIICHHQAISHTSVTENETMSVIERKSPRFPFIASAQVTETRTEARLQARTSDLSREGCYLDMLNPLPTGTRLKINVTHHNQQLDAVGRVVHSELNVGMGVHFEEVGQKSLIDAWLAELA
jgi:hypothetical protein